VTTKYSPTPPLVLPVKERKWMHSEESDLIDFAFPVLVLNSAPSQHQFQLQSSTETESGNVTALQTVAV
jgi:hypothetical protein